MTTRTIVTGFTNPALAGHWPEVLITEEAPSMTPEWTRGRAVVNLPEPPHYRRFGLEIGQHCQCPFCASLGGCKTYTTASTCAFCVVSDHRPERRHG